MPSPSWWKSFYSEERVALGTRGLAQIFERAPLIKLAHRGAIIFPHTRLAASGYLTAAAARSVIDSGCDTVVALGVLHGIARDRTDAHGIHFEGAVIRDEFSLDNFSVLLNFAAKLTGSVTPRYVPAYPLWRNEDVQKPEAMPGFSNLASLIENGAVLVATADMVHHGAGYGTAPESQLAIGSAEAVTYSETAIAEQLTLLANRNYPEFLAACGRAHSDFRDVGPVLMALLPERSVPYMSHLTLVNYADVLDAQEPTWVAAALATFEDPLS